MQKPKRASQPKPAPKLQTEQIVRDTHEVTKIVGVDEVGRGALAGPICVAAVEITAEIPGVTDSKLISPTRRVVLSYKISQVAKQIRLGWASNTEIDKLGLSPALALAYERALESIDAELILTDNVKLERPHISKIRGDQYFYSIAAASIVAKTIRDNLMRSYHQFYSGFDWANNVGYGTKKHFDGISKNNSSPLHRLSFLK